MSNQQILNLTNFLCLFKQKYNYILNFTSMSGIWD